MEKKSLCCASLIFLIGFCITYASPMDSDSMSDLKNAIVQIYTTYQKHNYNMPWQMLTLWKKSGSGCVISSNRIITNAHVVSDQTFIQVKRAGDVDRYTATVEHVAHDCDLAILRVEDQTFFRGIAPVQIGDLPKLRDKVSVYGFPISGTKLAITEGVVSRIEIGDYAHSSRNLLKMQIDALVASGNSGGPIFKEQMMVGIAFQGIYDIGEAIPAPIIKHFLKDLEDGVYNGFPFLGISKQSLENPSMRETLKMGRNYSGVYVRNVDYNTSAWPEIRKGDVLMRIDGQPIANDGTVPYMGDRIDFSYFANIRHIGEMLKVTVLRNGRLMDKVIRLKKIFRLVPYSRYGIQPTYYIFSGLVFMPLTENYLDVWKKWDDVPAQFKNLFYSGKASRTRKEIIVLAHILAHNVNKGYQGFSLETVTHINGKIISSTKELKTALENDSKKFLRIGLGDGSQIYFDVKTAKKASSEILEKYKINAHCSDDLKKQ